MTTHNSQAAEATNQIEAQQGNGIVELQGEGPNPVIGTATAMPEITMTQPEGDTTDDGTEKPKKKIGIDIIEADINGTNCSKYVFQDSSLQKFFGGIDPYSKPAGNPRIEADKTGEHKDYLSVILQNIVLAVELGKHLRPEDILTLYSVSKSFHYSIKDYLLSSVLTWIDYRCPKAGQIFLFKFYKSSLTSDPRGSTWGDQRLNVAGPLTQERAREVRTIPGLKYLQMILVRERYCYDIIAILARNGHRLPKTMHTTLLRLWLLMEVATSRHRQGIIGSTEMWPDLDLYNAQLFFVKLLMHFNDPVFGPCSSELLRVILGQKGLYPLWQLLMRKKYTGLPEITELKVRYDLPRPPHRLTPPHRLRIKNRRERTFYGLPLHEVGIMHKEGWGTLGDTHLPRPDELVPVEAVYRGLHLDDHLRYMVLWGHFDWKTGENLVPTEEEMYISDEENLLAHMDTTHHWRKKHALKKRWTTLTPEQRQEIIDEEEDDRLRALAWAGDDPDGSDGDHDSDMYDLNDEMKRGFIVRHQPANHRLLAPASDNKAGWGTFVNSTMMALGPQVERLESMRGQAVRDDIRRKIRQRKRERHSDWRPWMDQNGWAERLRAALANTNTEEQQEDYDGESDETTVPEVNAGTGEVTQGGVHDGDAEMEDA